MGRRLWIERRMDGFRQDVAKRRHAESKQNDTDMLSADVDDAHQVKSTTHKEWLQITRTSANPEEIARHSTGMPGDSGVDRHEAHQAWLTHMLETAAAHVVAQKHKEWLDAQRLCTERIRGTRNCHDPWLADPTIDAV